jgi:A/G-specific adenine glycosylase
VGQSAAAHSPDAADLQRRLLRWHASNCRDYPWRRTDDPYAVLVAEKLLQQTAARQVTIAAFEEFMRRYPSVEDLAEARVDDLERIFAPLGLRYRAAELKALAAALVEWHGGKVPADLRLLKDLPGVGDYAARAVLSFAYRRDAAVVDTNVARFLYRVFEIPGPLPANPARKKHLLDLAQAICPLGRSRQFNLAVLDLCALVCTPARPKCPSCPVQPLCAYGRTVTG